MIIVLEAKVKNRQRIVDEVLNLASHYEGVSAKPYEFSGTGHTFTEIHLIGSTAAVPTSPFESLPGVLRVVRVSTKYRLIGRHDADELQNVGFEYNGVRFGDDHLNIFAGLCAVDTKEHVEMTMAALKEQGIVTTRMGAYKPRTSPYDFQGLGKACLPYVFELAGKYGVRVVSMEVTDARHIDEIREALEQSGKATGVMLQIGTRNAQNFELLRTVGEQKEFPVLFKRGMGITLEESLNACEYIASEGNPNIVFCLRGVKSLMAAPHRNLVDFGHVPVVRRQTRLPVCVDPSHSVGKASVAPDGIMDIFHVTGQGIIAGATMVLVDFHPRKEVALCDGPQALDLEQLAQFNHYAKTIRNCYKSLVQDLTPAA
ncbi:MAG: 3-deoxy-7-phosphoheptulonate synthase [Myxococcales bacterium]|nr:MAG: 3-deoxy-7-phosphoheptulonate synthase [Myxococcales bacterium]